MVLYYFLSGLIPTVDMGRLNIKCLMINRADGSCRSFSSSEQMSLIDHSVCLDPVYDNLWRYCYISLRAVC
jgi:E3 ubiquitin-protein ligase MYCBP2